MEQTQRLAFADVLRGLASITVVIGHFIVLSLTAPDHVAAVTAGAPGEKVAFPAWLDQAIVMANPPATGVAVFFLISGFVIPMSLANSTVRAFLLKRFFRIYPPLWVALALTAAAIFISGTYWSRPSPYGVADYVANVFLAADLVTRFDVLTVAWTLQIEIKFYLLAVLVFMVIERRRIWPLLLFAGAVTATYLIVAQGCASAAVMCWEQRGVTTRFLIWEAMFISYMLIGSVIYAHYSRRIGTGAAILGCALLFGLFQIDLTRSPLPFLNPSYHLPYTWGLIIFASCYLLRDRIRLVQPFGFLADVSYPLYLVHPIVGYVTIRLLMGQGLTFWPSFAVAMVFVLALAWVIHVYVEAPSIALSKRIAARWAPSRRPAAREAGAIGAVAPQK